MKLKNRIKCVFPICFCAALIWAKNEETKEAKASDNSNIAMRVLLQRSPEPQSFKNTQLAFVRIDGVVKKAPLSSGVLHFSRLENSRIQLVRIPYRPIAAQSIELLWPYDKPGLEWEGELFRGRVLVEQSRGELYVVNTLPVEAYLASTVGGEMSASWNLEALKAQAVAARSYAIYRHAHPKHSLYDLERTTEDQVYFGVRSESPRTWNAVKETVGLYLAQSGKPALAHYHSRCGGETVTAEGVWNRDQSPGLRVPCAYCRRFPFRWLASWTPAEFLRKLGLAPSAQAGVVPIRRSESGRVYDVEVSNGEETRRFSADNLRRLLGYSTVKSSTFSVTPGSHQVQAEGVGAGHGVGMCQWGAKYLADKGVPFDKILAHYYPLHSLKKEGPGLFVQR